MSSSFIFISCNNKSPLISLLRLVNFQSSTPQVVQLVVPRRLRHLPLPHILSSFLLSSSSTPIFFSLQKFLLLVLFLFLQNDPSFQITNFDLFKAEIPFQKIKSLVPSIGPHRSRVWAQRRRESDLDDRGAAFGLPAGLRAGAAPFGLRERDRPRGGERERERPRFPPPPRGPSSPPPRDAERSRPPAAPVRARESPRTLPSPRERAPVGRSALHFMQRFRDAKFMKSHLSQIQSPGLNVWDPFSSPLPFPLSPRPLPLPRSRESLRER
mmetsp:Transcript_2936/g.6716  ORF Transcript_2936/g.6716 Transcript_2936/m.6716 type:complete len:269 (+) Transcript_2936:297-1103(+)